jgi:hypothetical protein
MLGKLKLSLLQQKSFPLTSLMLNSRNIEMWLISMLCHLAGLRYCRFEDNIYKVTYGLEQKLFIV